MDKIIKNWINQSNIPDYQKKFVFYYIKYEIYTLNSFKVKRKVINYSEIDSNIINDKNTNDRIEIYLDLQRPLIYSIVDGSYIGYYTGNDEKGYKYYLFIKK